MLGCVLLLVIHCQTQDCRSADPSCHTCVMTAGGHTCNCDDGFIVTEDGKKCKENNWLGCYTDNPKDRVWKPENRPQFRGLLTVQKCIYACQNSGHTYAGLINQDVCFCGNDHNLELYGRRPSADCSRPCPGKGDETCGARARLEIYSVCPRGYYDSGSAVCNQRCHCKDDHICSRRGTCPTNCAQGWKGWQCQYRDCSYENGGCEQVCISESRSNWCSCQAGYEVNPDDSLSCMDINECTNGRNQCEQICINEMGNYSCDCEEGFELTERYVCEDSNECINGQNQCEQICINEIGNYSCDCGKGFELTGRYVCEDVDECTVNNGGCESHCNNTVGSYQCYCGTGYILSPQDTSRCQVTSSQQSDSSRSDATLAAAVGATLGVLVIATIVGAAVIILIRRRRRQRDKDDIDGVDNGVVDSSDVVIDNDDNNYANTSEAMYVAGAIGENTEQNLSSKAVAHVNPLASGNVYLHDVDLDTRIHHKATDIVNKPNPTPPHGESGEANIYANVNEQPALSRPISLDQLAGEAALITSSKSNLKAEYESIPKKIGCASFAFDPAVKPKNRFKDIVPYDHNRVELTKRADEPHSDYINASHIEGYRGRQMIATHGPTKETLNDFWRMIWEHDISVVVMVTNPIENGKKKCEVYWGSGGDLTCDELTIHLQSEVVLMDYIMRTLRVTKASCPARSVQQYHYTSWPDHDVPAHGPSLLRLCRRAFHVNTGQHPCVVHCSAGVGRTGTLLAVDWLLQEADDTKTVDIPRCVYQLRTQRMNMVQTQVALQKQYEFLYTILAEGTRVGTTASSKEHLQNPLNTDILRSRAVSEFQILTQHGATQDITKTALLDANRPKNRTDVLPVDQHRVRLISTHPDSNDYINAIFVFGFHRKGEFIATQWPLEGTTVDLWSMISDYKVKNVVLLDTADDKNGFHSFLPSRDSPLDFGKLAVFCEKRTRHTDYLQESLTVKTGLSPTPETSENTNVAALSDSDAIYMNTTQLTQKAYKQSHGVTMWCVHNAKEISGRPQQLAAIYRDLSPIIKETGDLTPVLVISRDGCKGCGLYIAMATELDMLETEGEIDPFYTVQYMKTAWPEFFSSQEEYTQLYDILIQLCKA